MYTVSPKNGQIDKLTTFWCNISSGLRIPKIIEIGPRYSKKQKGGSFFE